jgi:aminoglycoside phosphotransferase (APT) family kinase protein
MRIRAKPPAEVAIDAPLIRALLEEQHADLAHLPLVEVGEGWDNTLFRLGDRLIVRVPRRQASALLIEHEQQWLPRLSPRLPLPVPVPLRVGRPGCGFPWSWLVAAWLPGQSALRAPPQDLEATAASLGQFLRALHQPAPRGAPRNPWRGVALAARAMALHEHLQQLEPLVDRDAALDLWERALATPAWSGPPLWLHGDLHPGNLLVDGGRLSAVVDFGDLAAGDPATDLSVAWMLVPASLRSTFLASARTDVAPIDEEMVMRARGWALALGLAYLANSRDDEAMGALGRTTIEAALRDDT